MSAILDLVKGLLATNAARVIAYGGVAALFIADRAAKLLGVDLTPEVVTAIQAIGVFVVTELVRRFVWSQASVEQIKSGG